MNIIVWRLFSLSDTKVYPRSACELARLDSSMVMRYYSVTRPSIPLFFLIMGTSWKFYVVRPEKGVMVLLLLSLLSVIVVVGLVEEQRSSGDFMPTL